MGLGDPGDARGDINFRWQTARLLHGSRRETWTLGAPEASDTDILARLDDVSLSEFVQELPQGLDYLVQEGGLGLSGGQRQSLLVARMMLRHPKVLLLDEPTAALDEVSEAAVIESLKSFDPEATLVIATHRPAVLRIVNRLIVLHGGKIAMDGPKDEVLAKLQGVKVAVA